MVPSCEQDGEACEAIFTRWGFLSVPETSQICSCFKLSHWYFTLPKTPFLHIFAWFTSFSSFKSLNKLVLKSPSFWGKLAWRCFIWIGAFPGPWEGSQQCAHMIICVWKNYTCKVFLSQWITSAISSLTSPSVLFFLLSCFILCVCWVDFGTLCFPFLSY